MTDPRRLALVTGTSRGIGKAIAEKLAADGFVVVGTATSEAGARSIDAWLGRLGGRGRQLDVRQLAAASGLVAELEQEFGAVSVLVNSAGITRDMIALRMRDDEWDEVIQTNLISVQRMCSLVSAGMQRQRNGRIVTIGSVVGAMGNFGQANYAASKSAVIGMSKALAAQFGASGITVNVVAPGFIDTDMTRNLSEDVMRKLMDRLQIPRLGLPADVAEAVSFLVSDKASYITGQTLHVNGGMLMV